MSGRVFSADRVARLETACSMLLVSMEQKLTALQKLSETGVADVYRNVASEPLFTALAEEIVLFVACAAIAPERMAQKLDDLARRFKAQSLRALLISASHELREIPNRTSPG